MVKQTILCRLMAEREQGITIDVAYRYFNTEKRSFIVADTPGHEEYTRNMAVGASFADLAIILVDAKQGVLVQTRRHSRICSLMGIKHFIFAMNKMDLVGYSEERFNEVKAQIQGIIDDLGLPNVQIIPVSATEGDKVTNAVTATVLWMDDSKLENGKNFCVKLGTKQLPAIVTSVKYAIVADEFKKNKVLGELILIDRITNQTSACGVVTEVHLNDGKIHAGKIDGEKRASLKDSLQR